jgi:hypothetical protein
MAEQGLLLESVSKSINQKIRNNTCMYSGSAKRVQKAKPLLQKTPNTRTTPTWLWKTFKQAKKMLQAAGNLSILNAKNNINRNCTITKLSYEDLFYPKQIDQCYPNEFKRSFLREYFFPTAKTGSEYGFNLLIIFVLLVVLPGMGIVLATAAKNAYDFVFFLEFCGSIGGRIHIGPFSCHFNFSYCLFGPGIDTELMDDS